MKTTIRSNIKNLPYSLHDMCVTEMRILDDGLHMSFQNGFESTTEPYEQIEGSVQFHHVDWDFCYVYILDFCDNIGSFTGRKQFLIDFIPMFVNQNFTIIDETYGYNQSKFSGFLSVGTEIKECMIEVYHLGDMEYITEK